MLEKRWSDFATGYRANPEAAAKYLSQGESPRAKHRRPAELAAYTGVASLMLNLDEAVTKQ